MGKGELTRRQLLAGLAGASGVGVAVGTGTATMVTDETTFRDTTWRSGQMALSVDWESGGKSGTGDGLLEVPVDLTGDDPTQVIDLEVGLPDLGGENNDAAVWMRAPCPEDGELARALDVTIRRANCTGDCELFSGSLWDLTAGVHLDGDSSTEEGDCLSPGETVAIETEVGLTDFEGDGSATFSLEFVGTQCRYTDGENPFGSGDGCDSGGDPRHAISFVAFCSSADESIDPSLSVTASDDDGDPLEVGWQTATDVDFVAVKASTGLTVYDLRGAYRDAGSAFPGDTSAAVPAVTLEPGQAASPCEVAADELGADPTAVTRTTKLEWTDEDWRVDE